MGLRKDITRELKRGPRIPEPGKDSALEELYVLLSVGAS
jgi:hypothetical protein